MRSLPKRVATAGLWLAIVAAGARAQTSQFEGRTITAIRNSPASPLDPADLAAVQPLKIGEPLRAADVAQAIDGLFSTGRFTDVSVEADPSATGVAITFVTAAQYFVGGVTVEGRIASPPNPGELHGNTQFAIGTPFQESDIARAVDSMKKLLQSDGLYEAQIEPHVESDPSGQQVFITFTVNAGKRAKYAQPEINGNTMLSDDTILRATGWRVPLIHWWRHVTDARTRGGVQGLLNKYASQDRLTAKVQLGNPDYDAATRKVTPHLTLDPGPAIKLEAVESKLSNRVLKRYVPVYREHAVDTDLLVEGKRNLQDYLQSQGYYDADVDFRVQPAVNDVETIQYVISKGERHRLMHLEITGNRFFDNRTIRERMFMTPSAFNLRRGRYSRAFQNKDEENIADLYKANGYRDVKVTTTVDDDYKGKKGDVSVTVNVSEGSQWIVDKLDISGMTQIPPSSVVPLLSSIAGQAFAEVSMATDRNALLTYYYERGFPSASFKAQWQPSGAPHHVNVQYLIAEGSRQYVRDVLISGNKVTRQSLIDRMVTLKPGDPLSPVEETNIQKRFYDLGVFARVDTAIQNADGSTDHKYVLYNFEDAKRYTVNVGVGAQVAQFGSPSAVSLDSPAGKPGFSPEISAEVSRTNLWGIGHSVSLRALYSSIEKRASVSYLQPQYANDAGRSLSYTLLYDNTLDIRTFASKREEASVQLSQRFSKSLTGLFRVAYRRVSVSDVIIPVLLVPQFIQPVRLGIVSANLIQDRRNNSTNPTKGIYNTLDIGIADKVLGSQRNFGRILVRNATYYKLSKNLILARQTQFGVILPFGNHNGLTQQESVPLPERFFGGGADSLRAFPYNEAGPRDVGTPLIAGGPSSQATGFPLGGNALFFNNVELRFPLLGENIQGVLFHDMGNVFSSLSDISFRYKQRDLTDFNYTAHAAGFGIRYRTPVGPIRVDLAYSLNPPSFNGFSGTPAQLLTCNPNIDPSLQSSYCTPSKQSVNHLQFFFSIGQTF
jgi:outer membrane protein assembly complex protein YaeT